MALHLHRADRTDLLADGLAQLLADPLPDPFAEELVLVSARGVERWLSQRLSHVLGRGAGTAPRGTPGRRRVRRRGVPASAVADRRADRHRRRRPVVARRHGVAAAARSSTSASTSRGAPPWPPTSATSRAARRRSCAGAGATPSPAGSPACSRPTPGSARSCSSTGSTGRTDGLDAGPAVAARRSGAPCSTASTSTRRTSGTPKPLPDCRSPAPTCRSGCRCSATPGCRSPRSNCSTRWALTTTCTCGCRTPATSCGRSLHGVRGAVPRRDDTSHRGVGHPLLATLGRDLRELQRSLPARRADRRMPADRPSAPTPCSAGCSPTSPPTPSAPQGRHAVAPTTARSRCTAATARPARSTCCARCCSGLLADDPTLEPRDILVMCPDIETYAPLIVAGFGLGDVVRGAHPAHRLRVQARRPRADPDQPAARRRRAAARRWPAAGPPPARCSTSPRPTPVRARFGFTDDDLDDDHRLGARGQHPLGLRLRAPPALRRRLRAEHLAVRPRPGAGRGGDVRRLARLARHHAAARRRRQQPRRAGRPARRVRRPAAAPSSNRSPAHGRCATG